MQKKENKTTDLKTYMADYRQKTKMSCPCGGSYNKHTEEKHLVSKKHLKKVAEIKKEIVLEKEPILEWLEKRFIETDTTNGNSKTKRVNKNIGIWKKLFESTTTHTYKYFLENRLEIVKNTYNTPSSQQTALSTLKLILDHVEPLSVEEKKKIFEEGSSLSKEYKEAPAVIKENAMSYDDLKKYEDSDKPVVAIFAHLYAPDVPALRLGDWVNSTIGKSKTMNQIILSTGNMLRRISKNNKGETIIPLPKHLIKYFKTLKIKGALFGDMTSEQVSQQVAKELGPSNGSRYWRTKYVSEIVSKMSGAERVKVAEQMDHSIEIQVSVYQKDEPQPLKKKGKFIKLK
jgi:hypothetical protein